MAIVTLPKDVYPLKLNFKKTTSERIRAEWYIYAGKTYYAFRTWQLIKGEWYPTDQKLSMPADRLKVFSKQLAKIVEEEQL